MKLLTLRECSERLTCSLANVYALKDAGLLCVVATGARGKGYRVAEQELQRFIEEGTKRREPQIWPEKTKAIKFKHLR